MTRALQAGDMPVRGVTAALLRQHGIEVFAETEIDALCARLTQAV